MNLPVPRPACFCVSEPRTKFPTAPPPLPPGPDAASAAVVLREIVEYMSPLANWWAPAPWPTPADEPITGNHPQRHGRPDRTPGLLFAPHTSAGRLPTDQGLRLFVDGLPNFGELSEDERVSISGTLAAAGRSLEDTLAEASSSLSSLSAAAGLVLAPKSEGAIKHIELFRLGRGEHSLFRSTVTVRWKIGLSIPARPAPFCAAAGQQLSECPPVRPATGGTMLCGGGGDGSEPNRTRCPIHTRGGRRAGDLDRRGRSAASSCGPGSFAFGRHELDRITAIQIVSNGWRRRRRCSVAGAGGTVGWVRTLIGAESGVFNTSGVSMVVVLGATMRGESWARSG